MNDQLLPIGTVILLKGGTKELMITGYLVERPSKFGGSYLPCR